MLGFPGVGGVLRDGTADYVRIPQQPTALQTGRDPRLDELARTVGRRGLAIQRVTDMMDGSPTTPRSSPASPPPCTGAARIPAAWPPIALLWR